MPDRPADAPGDATGNLPETFGPANTTLIGQDAIARRLGLTLKETEALCEAGTLAATLTGAIWSATEDDLAAYLREHDAPGGA